MQWKQSGWKCLRIQQPVSFKAYPQSPYIMFELKTSLKQQKLNWDIPCVCVSLSLFHTPALHCTHILQRDAAFPSFHVRTHCTPILGFWDIIFCAPILGLWDRNRNHCSSCFFTEWICFKPTVCLIYQSFSCYTCKAHPHMIFQQAGNNPIGKLVSFFSLSFFGAFQ